MPIHQRDYFAELYVAGLMGDNGWNVYFPKRDIGFDFIATKNIASVVLIRPVQVKGLYPSEAKKDKTGYGYIGTLSQIHEDMVLVLPYFPIDRAGPAPVCIAFMPCSEIRTQMGRGYKCFPAKFVSGRAEPRETFRKFFGLEGLLNMELPDWGKR
jgi:hypothetical protein